MLSIIIIASFFSKLDDINKEYVVKIDQMTVQMKDFAVKIDHI